MRNSFTSLQEQIIGALATIEQTDQEMCDKCGGEDCQCCEIYHDRNRWIEPDELLAEETNSYLY